VATGIVDFQVSAIVLVIAALGCVYLLSAAVIVRRFKGVAGQHSREPPGVTILKPLSGLAPPLYDDLASFCDQDYPGSLQVLLGVRDSADGAIEVVHRLIRERPGRELELVVHVSGSGPNPKIANVIGMEHHIRHPVVILADADILVSRTYVREIIAALNRPGVGAVTCMYRGSSGGGIWTRLASMGIDYHFLPNVLVGLELGLAQPCFGSTIALRRETLDSVGGFQAFAACLADDYAVGRAVRATGMKVGISSLILEHSCSEQSIAELLSHELRWARTVRAASPLGYAGLMISHPLPFAILGATLSGLGLVGIGMVVAAIGCRLVLQWQVDHTLKISSDRWWLAPVRDLMAFGVYVAGFFVNVVQWGGQRYRIRSDGTLITLEEGTT